MQRRHLWTRIVPLCRSCSGGTVIRGLFFGAFVVALARRAFVPSTIQSCVPIYEYCISSFLLRVLTLVEGSIGVFVQGVLDGLLGCFLFV